MVLINDTVLLYLPSSPRYLGRMSFSNSHFLSSFLFPFPSLTNVCSQRGKKIKIYFIKVSIHRK